MGPLTFDLLSFSTKYFDQIQEAHDAWFTPIIWTGENWLGIWGWSLDYVQTYMSKERNASVSMLGVCS
jgi:hypothetical protein